MYFYELIKNISKNKKTKIYVDMDGVIASYDFGKPLNFKAKRPINTNINTLKKISKLQNIELFILSVCRLNNEVNDKNDWLNKYAPFFDKKNRIILPRENTPYLAKELKLNYLKTLKTNEQIIVIDDDNEVLKIIHENIKDIILYQDSEMID